MSENNATPKFTKAFVKSTSIVEISRLDKGDKEGDSAILVVSAGWWDDKALGFEVSLSPTRMARINMTTGAAGYRRYLTADQLGSGVIAILEEWKIWCDQFWEVAFGPEAIIQNWFVLYDTLNIPFSFQQQPITQ